MMNTDLLTALENESRALIAQLDAHPKVRQLFEGTLDTEAYAHYLAQTYHYVRWTTPLLALAGQRMVVQGRHPALASLLLHKAKEETGHERWLLADLRHLGWSSAAVERTPRGVAVEAYVAWNRFTSEAGSPTAFLGTAYVLEALSASRAGAAARNLVERGGIPGIHRAVTFLRGHGDADEGHVSELATLLGSLTDPGECEALILSARMTRLLYPGLFEEPRSVAPALGAPRT
ncbi:heme oxygenase-like protein [Archangium gephyra]|uniref:Heme oxygenase-like protein n=1 Tax=Archangium gephyra TaxID=48 RepID=A0AAC8Q8Y6_9BACT|nr:iron-containing redox enzyme family protein [Archangium gephyra]AKJ02969.1 long-chain acyl-CoA synthetase [Archangium gephyra]REG25094.1 heme oxygenase-like protein [Archangium gephyra]